MYARNTENSTRSWFNSKDEVISIWKQWRFLRTQKISVSDSGSVPFARESFSVLPRILFVWVFILDSGRGSSCKLLLPTWQSFHYCPGHWPVLMAHVRDRHSLLCVIFALSEFYYVQSKISLSLSFVPSVSLACSMCELGSLGFLWT